MKISSQLVFLVLTGFSLCQESDTLYILHTNNTNGEIENCYCPDHPLGSIEKRTRFIDDFRKKYPNTIVVDAGDMWGVTARLPEKDHVVTKSYGLMKYDAILPGDQELTRLDRFNEQTISELNSTLVISNLLYPKIPGSTFYKIMEVGETTVGILGIMGPGALKYYPDDVKDQIHLKPQELALGELIPEVRQKADLVIVLSHQGFDADVELATSPLDIDVIIGAHSQTKLDSAVIINGTLISQAGKDGYYVGAIKMVVENSGNILKSDAWLEPMTLEMPDDPRVMNFIYEFEEKTGVTNRRKKAYLQGE